jgi:signal transduction histidine kinase/ActR/RegA family two-component response regulator
MAGLRSQPGIATIAAGAPGWCRAAWLRGGGKDSMANRLRWALLLMLAALSATTAGRIPETPLLRTLGVADGLPHTRVGGLARDRAGYLWISTDDGLARHDGVDFQVWRHVPGDPASLPRNVLQMGTLHVDAHDRVWVASEGGGLSVLDAGRRGFRHFDRSSHPAMGSDDVWAVASRDDILWFGSYAGGLHRMRVPRDFVDTREIEIERFVHDPVDPRSLPSDIVLALAFDDAGRLWVATTAGVARLDGDGFVRVALPGDPAPLVYSLFSIEERIWAGAASGVFAIDAGGAVAAPPWSAMFERPNAMLALARDRDGWWLGSQRGLWRIGPDGVPAPVPTPTGVSKAVTVLLLQPDGALWAPVHGVGLGYLRPDWRAIAKLVRDERRGLSGGLYQAVAPARAGGFWLANDAGAIERIDGDGRVHRVREEARRALQGLKFNAVLEDPDGDLWLGYQRGLARIHRFGGVRIWTPDGEVDPAPAMVRLLAVDPGGHSLWLGAAGGGVQQRELATGRILAQWPAGDAFGLGEADLEAMRFAPDGSLWVASGEGMRRLAPGGARFEPVPGIAPGRIHGFDFAGGDGLWLHRLDGLESYRHEGGRWTRVEQVGPVGGIPAVESGGLRVDAEGRPWLATPRGLYRWDPEPRRTRHFGSQNGLGSQEFVDRTLVIDARGVLAATVADGGVVLLDSRAPEPAPRTPPLVLESVDVRRDGRWIGLGMVPGRMPELASFDRELRVVARLLDFEDPRGNRYWSRLDGYDRDWVPQGAVGERILAGLGPGDYVLRMRGSDADGNLAGEQVLRFGVRPPWWATPWSRAAALLAMLALLTWAAVAYRHALRRRHALQLTEQRHALAEQASLAKTRFLATLGHEVRTPMTGVLGMSELLLATDLDPRQRGYAQSIHHAGHHLVRLVNDALDLARIEAGRLELELAPFDLHALAAEMLALMAPLAQQRGLGFGHSVDPGTPRWVLGDCARVRQVLLNLLNNAIKFTAHGQVALELAPAADGPGVRFGIVDTGPGLNDEQKARLFRRFEQGEGARTAARYGGSGLGLAISQELASAMGGRIEVDSAPGEGTRFTVTLPLPAADPRQSGAPGVPSRAATIPLRLLLVEDDGTVAQVLAGLLRAQGHEVVHAVHGLAALAEVAGAVFDAALLDLDLPGMDGLALARQLRAQGFTRPLLAVTARADAQAEPLARAAGFDAFLRKPLTGEALAEALVATVPAAPRCHSERSEESA